MKTLVRPLWRAAGSGAKAPPLAARPKRRVLEKIPGQLEASFLIFLTLGSIKQSNTPKRSEQPRRAARGINQKKLRSASASYSDFAWIFAMIHHVIRSEIMSLNETCLSLNVGLYVCVVEKMITFTQVQMCTCLCHKCSRYVYMYTYVHTYVILTHKHIYSHIHFHTYVEW